jgi:hypothetical protein
MSYGSLFPMASFSLATTLSSWMPPLFVIIIHGTPKANFNETHVAYYHNIIID